MFDALAGVDPAGLSPQDAITYLEVLDRFICWLNARQVRALVVAAGESASTTICTAARGSVKVDLTDVIREEIAAALRLAPGTAQMRVDRARLLTGPLSRTGDALAAAEITYGHASVITDAVNRLSTSGSIDPQAQEAFARACQAMQDRVLPIARRGTVGRARAAAERALLALDAEHIEEQRRRNRAAADVQVFDEPAGMSTLWARLTTEMAHACMASINAYAASERLAAPECMGIGARRALALAALLTGGAVGSAKQFDAPEGLGPQQAGEASSSAIQPRLGVHLDITISAESLLGISSEPAELKAAGSSVPVLVPACAIRELAALDGVDRLTWRRLLLDQQTGHLLDRGRDAYRVSRRMKDWISARDRTCRFPGCERRAEKCEIDHAVAWDAGGRTVRGNLGALCKRHHLMKTHAGWAIDVSADDGSCTWISPFGHRYLHEVVPLGDEVRRDLSPHHRCASRSLGRSP